MSDSSNDLTFTTVGGRAVVGNYQSGGSGLKNPNLKRVIIPSTYNGMNVFAIGYEAFGNAQITHVFIPNTIEEIRFCAFYRCFSLLSVLFAQNSALRKIDGAAFAFCKSLVYIDIPSSVISITNDPNNCPFYDLKYLICLSYLGQNSFQGNGIIVITNRSLVIHTLPGYSTAFGEITPTKDGRTCESLVPKTQFLISRQNKHLHLIIGSQERKFMFYLLVSICC